METNHRNNRRQASANIGRRPHAAWVQGEFPKSWHAQKQETDRKGGYDCGDQGQVPYELNPRAEGEVEGNSVTQKANDWCRLLPLVIRIRIKPSGVYLSGRRYVVFASANISNKTSTQKVSSSLSLPLDPTVSNSDSMDVYSPMTTQ